jgi:hypothetical protein
MFGGSEDLAGMCPHTLMREQLEDHLNHHRNLALLGKILNETYAPLKSLARLPTTPQVYVASLLRKEVQKQAWFFIESATFSGLKKCNYHICSKCFSLNTTKGNVF